MELSETIELMQSEDFKERFKAEYWQTKIRHDKLAEMIKKYEAGTLELRLYNELCKRKIHRRFAS